MKCLLPNHFSNFQTIKFELNAINIIDLTLFYLKIYKKIIYEEKYCYIRVEVGIPWDWNQNIEKFKNNNFEGKCNTKIH